VATADGLDVATSQRRRMAGHAVEASASLGL
jgi:hypothetical protein